MKEIPLVLFGCIHFGFRYADLEYTQRAVDWAKEHGAMVGILGDNFENAIPAKPYMMHDQMKTPQEQVEEFVEMFRPIRKQVVLACTSNHSKRSKKNAGIDLDKQVAMILGYEKKYAGDVGHTVLKAGSQRYTVVYTHGVGSGSDVLSDFKKLNKMYPNPDIIAASHTHECLTTKKGYFNMTGAGRSLKPILFVRTGSAIEYPSYAEEQLYSPQPKGFSTVWLSTDKHQTRCETYCDFK